MADKIRIGLLWHSASSGNLGVGALTLSDIAIITAIAHEMGLKPEFTVLSMRDGDTAPITPPDVAIYSIDSRSMLRSSGYRKVVQSLDCVVDIGAGDSFAEIYGAKRFAFLWLSKYMAIRLKVPLILAPQTIGPFTRAPYKQLAAYVMNRSAAVVSRDEQSLKVARDMAPAANNQLSVDVAFVLPFQDRSAERGQNPLRFGLNVSGLLYHEAETGRNHFGLSYDYARFTDRLIETLLARPDIQIHLVPHATSKGKPDDDDGRRADILAQRYPGLIRVPDFPGPSEAKSYISSLDFLVAGRMHACIGAYSAGTPVVPAAYSRKFSGLFGMLGYDHMLPVTGMNEDEALHFVLSALERRTILQQDMDAGMKQVQQRLDIYRFILRDVFAAIRDKGG